MWILDEYGLPVFDLMKSRAWGLMMLIWIVKDRVQVLMMIDDMNNKWNLIWKIKIYEMKRYVCAIKFDINIYIYIICKVELQ